MDTDTHIDPIKQKIDELNQKAWDCRVSDSIQTFELSKEAVRLSEENGYKTGLAKGLRTLGFSYIRMAQNQEAKAALHQSRALFEELNDQQGLSDIFEYYGIIHRFTGHYEYSLNYLKQSLEIREQTNYEEGISLAHYHLGVTYKYIGEYERALDHLFQCLDKGRQIQNWISESYSLNLIGLIHFETKDYHPALAYFEKSLEIRRQAGDKWGEAGCLDNIGFTWLQLGTLSNALTYCSQSLAISEEVNDQKGQGNALLHMATICQQMGEMEKAQIHAQKSLRIRQTVGDKKGEAEVMLFLSSLHALPTSQDHHFQFLQQALSKAEETGALDLLAKVHWQYYKSYKDCAAPEEALKHLEQYGEVEKKLHKDALNQKVLNLEISHRAEQSKKEAEIFRLRNIELANLNEESHRQKEEIEQQKKQLEKSLRQLQITQAQLIQQEKMASLGELTAGIAHEIQNPLNFVNNFSEANIELAEELISELDQLNLPEGDKKRLQNLINDIIQNHDKVQKHGKRADAIVKSMLLHSRTSTGEKELTDINALADEYLKFAYHSLRAKDKTFNVLLETHFDPGIGKINIAAQDIGRVFLNLYNNAFYSIHKKKESIGESYQPAVSVITKKLHSKVEISINDNGLGISEKSKEKIFQPFYTTKPTGEGTGLGLSLSYDMITKGYGGELKVKTKEGEYAEFIVALPIKSI